MESGAVTEGKQCAVQKSVDEHIMGKVGRNISQCLRLISVFEDMNEGFPGFSYNQAIFSVHVIGMSFQLSCLHITRLGGENLGEFNLIVCS
jgi:hypothetical protein